MFELRQPSRVDLVASNRLVHFKNLPSLLSDKFCVFSAKSRSTNASFFV